MPVLSAVAVTVVIGVIYRVVPNVRVPVAALLPPAVIVGLAISVLTQLFVFIAPRLVGSLAVFGSFAAMFAALAWLSLIFQALLMGAAWTRERMNDADPGSVPPTPAELGQDPKKAAATGTIAPVEPREPLPPPPPGVQPAPRPDLDD